MCWAPDRGRFLGRIRTWYRPLSGLHWFSGSLSELREAINMGCYFSVNTLMATSERGAYLISLMPHDKVLPESDGPFAIQGNLPLSPMSSNEVA